ncbi:hypothetical protein [Streptomyces sp. NPDC059009]|uniref:hypothetical protein n=1 Tax=Streptomyces sp. NPDC059009 TaxID=3346694 RepID=UPI0036C58364
MTTDPFDGHDWMSLMGIALLGLILTTSLTAYACTTLTRHGLPLAGPAVWLRATAALSGAGAIALYAWGAVHLMTFDETSRTDACQHAVGPAHAGDIDGYRPTYLPLRFGCHVKGGATYDVGVPGYVNPGALGLGVAAVVLAGLAGLTIWAGRRRARSAAEATAEATATGTAAEASGR